MIQHFKTDPYKWLSNMELCPIILDGNIFMSGEHAYQSKKCNSQNWLNICLTEPDPHKIKTLSRDIDVVDNWNDIKVNVMRTCLIQKLNQEPYKTLLINTGNEYIQEGNWWNDTFWGVDLKVTPPVGQNMLGKLIMEIRSNIISVEIL